MVTRGDWEDFQRGQIWRAIEATLNDWKDGVKDLPFSGEFSTDQERINEFMKSQGRIEAINYLLGIPETFAQALQFEEDEHGT